MQNKTKIIEKITHAPHTLSNDDILAIAGDDELKTLYDGAALMSAALADVPDFDIEDGLSQIHGRIGQTVHTAAHACPIRKGTWLKTGARKAAAIAAVVLTAMAMAAAVWLLPSRQNTPAEPDAVTAVTAEGQIPQTVAATDGRLCYDDAQLSQIIADIAERYGCRVEWVNTGARDSRYHLTVPADASLQQVADMLNAFDEVRITVKADTIIVE